MGNILRKFLCFEFKYVIIRLMKKCTKCKKEKQINEFSFKNKLVNIRHSQCKDCTRLLVKNHYLKNKQYYLDKTRKRNAKLYSEIIRFIQEYLKKNPCLDCGESDITVLEFDHNRDKFTKFKAVSSLIKSRYPIEIIKREINKCEIRCANCHRRKTARDFNWIKSKMRP